ncbi:hypothetical protein Bca101_058834 [Brassica carinata]
MSIERPKTIPQQKCAYRLRHFFGTFQSHVVGGVDVCKCITPNVLATEVERLLVSLYESTFCVVAMEIGLGIPRMYLCGALTVLLTSKTKENPGRRFYRCRVVFGDKHVFKWADDAYLEELELIAEKQSSMEKEVMEIKEHLLEIKKDITEIVEVVTALSTKIRK